MFTTTNKCRSAGFEEKGCGARPEARSARRKVMTARADINTGPPPAQTLGYDDDLLDRQRGGGGFLSFMLFPLISIAAIAFAAFELMH
jgi:hypothetical protein